jgi:hypothetical protein
MIIDDDNPPLRNGLPKTLEPETRSGAIFLHSPPKARAARPAGQWNYVSIRCEGPRVVVHLNGVEVQRLNMAEHTRPTRKSPALADLPRKGLLGLGHNEGRVDYRNVTIRKL